MDEFVSEKRHVENLFYVRELLKFELDEWVLEREAGHIGDSAEGAMNIITDLTVVDQALTSIYTDLKELEALNKQ